MATVPAFVFSCTRSGNNVVLVLSDTLGVGTNNYTATFPISDINGGTAGTAMTTLVRGLFASGAA